MKRVPVVAGQKFYPKRHSVTGSTDTDPLFTIIFIFAKQKSDDGRRTKVWIGDRTGVQCAAVRTGVTGLSVLLHSRDRQTVLRTQNSAEKDVRRRQNLWLHQMDDGKEFGSD